MASSPILTTDLEPTEYMQLGDIFVILRTELFDDIEYTEDQTFVTISGKAPACKIAIYKHKTTLEPWVYASELKMLSTMATWYEESGDRIILDQEMVQMLNIISKQKNLAEEVTAESVTDISLREVRLPMTRNAALEVRRRVAIPTLVSSGGDYELPRVVMKYYSSFLIALGKDSRSFSREVAINLKLGMEVIVAPDESISIKSRAELMSVDTIIVEAFMFPLAYSKSYTKP